MGICGAALPSAHKKMDNMRATVIIASGKADGKSEVSMRDSSLPRESLRSASCCSTTSFSLRSFPMKSFPSILVTSAVVGTPVCWEGLERSDEEVLAEIVGPVMVAKGSCYTVAGDEC